MSEQVNGLTMEQWLDKVDRIIFDKYGISVHDLADFQIWDLWHDGVSPEEGALEALENDDIGSMILEEFEL